MTETYGVFCRLISEHFFTNPTPSDLVHWNRQTVSKKDTAREEVVGELEWACWRCCAMAGRPFVENGGRMRFLFG